jgi:serine/threonine protein kinase
LIKLYGVCSTEEPVKIVTEFVRGGSLKDHLLLKRNEITQYFILNVASQVADGMRYIEKMKYIHRDLAARNVLLDENGDAKICDFGLAKLMKESVYRVNKSTYLPFKWTAIEGIQKQTFSIKSDVWGYGILLVELTNKGKRPYQDIIYAKDSASLLEYLESGQRHPQPESCPDFLYDLMLSCWRVKPSDRPSFEQIFNIIEKQLSLDNS